MDREIHRRRLDEAKVIRFWDAHERARGARSIIDYDFASITAEIVPAPSRIDVYDRLTSLLGEAQSHCADRIAEVVTAHLAYLRSVPGERPSLEQYIRETHGCRRIAEGDLEGLADLLALAEELDAAAQVAV